MPVVVQLLSEAQVFAAAFVPRRAQNVVFEAPGRAGPLRRFA